MQKLSDIAVIKCSGKSRRSKSFRPFNELTKAIARLVAIKDIKADKSAKKYAKYL